RGRSTMARYGITWGPHGRGDLGETSSTEGPTPRQALLQLGDMSVSSRLSRRFLLRSPHCKVTFQMPNEKSGHAYTAINQCYSVPKHVIRWLADPNNHNAFRLYYYCFPYPGCEFPPDQPQEKFFRESSGEVVIENAIEIEKWNQLADAYMEERYRNNEAVGGTVKLGPGGLVLFSGSNVA